MSSIPINFHSRQDVKDGNAVLYTPKEIKTKCPECWKYLSGFQDRLEKRSIQNGTPQTWYRFGRSQSLTKFNGDPTLVWPVLLLEPGYTYDDSNVVITGGGNGPDYALRPKDESGLSLFYLLGILSHPVIETFIRARSSKFRGGYGSHGKQFMINVPIPEIAFDVKASKLYRNVVELTQSLVDSIECLKSAKTPGKRAIFKRRMTAKHGRLMRAVETLYGLTPEDLKTIKTFERFDDK